MREVPIPAHITILFVEQEVIGDDTPAIDSVLKADVWRDHLLKEEASLNAKLAELEQENDEKRFDDAREEASSRLAEVHARLSEMDAESGPARAAALLAGLGFDEADQKRPTRSFSGGWRYVSVLYPTLLDVSLKHGIGIACVSLLLVLSSSRFVV